MVNWSTLKGERDKFERSINTDTETDKESTICIDKNQRQIIEIF